MSLNFFSGALRQAMASKHFNQAQLAEFLRVDPAYVSRWLKGSSPRLDQMRTVLIALGWDLDRARPDYDPFKDAMGHINPPSAEGGKVRDKDADYHNLEEVKRLLKGAAENQKRLGQPPVVHAGRLIASKGQLELDDPTDAERFEGFGTLVPTPEYAAEELSMLTVEGNELQPVYPNGTRLLIRRALRLNSVPDGTIVILEATRNPGSYHLRRLVRIGERKLQRVERLIGAPLVPAHDYMFFKPREVRVHFVVVGALTVAEGNPDR